MINPEEIGELVYLRPLEVQDIDNGWLDWVNNPDTSSELTSIGENKKLTKKYQKKLNPIRIFIN